MNAGFVTVLIGLGAAAIALWIDARFPGLAPRDLGRAVLHCIASVAVGYATTPAFQALVSNEDPRSTLLAVFALGFPSVVYCLLAGLWLIKATHQSLSGLLR